MFEPRSTRSDLLGALAAGLIVVAFCFILLGHDPLVFWNDDYEISVLPVFADVARSWSQGHLPLLSPYSWVCGNLAGEFQYGTFSIFVNAAVILIWKFPLTFAQQAAALSITHLFVLAAGGFVLARGRALPMALSIFVGLIAALNGWMICWGAVDWFGALGAFAWLPWAWWAMEKSLRSSTLNIQRPAPNIQSDSESSVGRLSRALWPAPFVYLVVTGGFPYTVVMLAVLVAWLSIQSIIQTKSLFAILPMSFGVALGFGLSAPAWLAIFDYVQGSARETAVALAHRQWVVPFSALPAFILPCWTVKWTDFATRMVPHTATELTCGLAAPAALLGGLIWRPRMLMRLMKWELILLLFVLVLCMLPTAGLFRWSFRWLPLFHLVLAICAAEVLRLRPGSPTASMAVLLLIAATIPMWLLDLAGNYGVILMLIYFVIGILWLVPEWFLPDLRFHEWAPTVVTFAIFLATYMCIPPNCGVPKYNFGQDLVKTAPLDPQRLYLSAYPPPERDYRIEAKPEPVGQIVRPGSTPMWAGLRFVNGYSPIIPAGVGRQWGCAIHGEIDEGMSRYLLDEQAGAGGQLARMGVDGIIVASEFQFTPKPDSEWDLVAASTEGRVYHRRGGSFARVRSVSAIDSLPNKTFAAAAISRIDDSRSRVEVDVDAPGGGSSALLTFARPYFRGYQAQLDNRKLRVDSYRGLFPVVELPSGSHGRLVLTYRPWWLVLGSTWSLLSAVLFIVAGVVAIYRRNDSFVIRDSSFDIR